MLPRRSHATGASGTENATPPGEAEALTGAISGAVTDSVVELFVPASPNQSCIPGMGTACPGGYGSGVVFEYPDLVLTAGHVVSSRDAQGNVVNVMPAGEQVWYRGVAYPIAQVVYHPNYFQGADLALVKLVTPIPVVPAQPSTVVLSTGMIVTMAGFGENKLDTVDPNEGGGALLHSGQLVFKNFQAIDTASPTDPLNSLYPNAYLIFGPGPSGTIGCEGDSGSPAFDSSGHVAGIFIWYFFPAGLAGTCANVTADNYISVGTFRSWIDGAVATLHPPRYGAIAYSFSTGAWGTSWAAADESTAGRVAVSYCSQPDCQVVQSVRNGCIALARGPAYTAWSYPTSSAAEARAAALGFCGAHSSGCTLVASLCADGASSD